MENFTSFKEVITPEIAVLVRAAFIAAFIFGVEALGKVRRNGGSERVKTNARQTNYAKRERLSKKRTLRV